MIVVAFVVLAAGGSVLRWQLGERVPRPAGTLTANLLGALALGLLAGASDTTDTLVGIGALGSLTTFSTLVLDLADLWDRDRRAAGAYTVATFVGGVAAAWLGLTLA